MTREEEMIQEAIQRFGDAAIGKFAFCKGAQWADEHPKNPWVSIEERLPEEDTEVVTYLRGTMVIGYRIGERWYMHGIAIDTPNHWMPIPSVEGGEV